MDRPEGGKQDTLESRAYEALKTAIITGVYPPGGQVVEELVVLHRGTLFEWRIYQEGFDVARQGRRMADALLRGLQTE